MLVDAIDRWRRALGLEKVVFIGHSFGGFVSSAYSLKHPEHVDHLILLDSWGLFPHDPDGFIVWYRVALSQRHHSPCGRGSRPAG